MLPDDGALVTLIYCIRSRASAGALESVEAHAERLPQLALTVINDADGERLIAQHMADVVRRMNQDAQAYLCGPEGPKMLVEGVWSSLGKAGAAHSARFDFRGACRLADLIYIGKPVLETARDWTKTKSSLINAAVGS